MAKYLFEVFVQSSSLLFTAHLLVTVPAGCRCGGVGACNLSGTDGLCQDFTCRTSTVIQEASDISILTNIALEILKFLWSYKFYAKTKSQIAVQIVPCGGGGGGVGVGWG